MKFTDLHLIEPILKALETEGYTTPTPIQEKAIPLILEKKDLLGCAQTGTGKTAAFSIPIIQLMYNNKTRFEGKRPIKCLILTPTRELAIQIGQNLTDYGAHTGIKNKVIFGGVNQHGQIESLRTGVDILVATPGRLLDLMGQKYVDLSTIEFFVLDEADRMLDMGFINDVNKVLTKLPKKRQSLFFSATMPPAIQQLANTILINPVKVEVTPVSSTASKIDQSVYFVDKPNKRNLLNDILKDQSIERVLIFTRTKHGANKVAEDLVKNGITAQAIHGNKSQNNRQRALNGFKSKEIRALVATDIAARGIDIDELTHVINFELPNIPESYVHRIGRTGRAGASGVAIAFCDIDEKEFLVDIEKLIGQKIRVIAEHDYPLKNFVQSKPEPRRGQRPQGQGRPRPTGEQKPKPQGGNTQGRDNKFRPNQQKPNSGSSNGSKPSGSFFARRNSGRSY